MARNNSQLTEKKYCPVGKVNGFTTISKKSGEVIFLNYCNKNFSYKLKIKPHGFIPKSGLLIAKTIENRVKGKKILDMCTGETGIIAIHSAIYGAKSVCGIDVENEIIYWAIQNGKYNKLMNINWKVGNLFNNLHNKYDLIISNPPQMPMEKGHIHDWGGLDGRSFIEKIIQESPKHLYKDGSLIMLIFDFLGVNCSYNHNLSIKKFSQKYNLDMKIILKTRRNIRKGGETEKSLYYILKKYPKYKFYNSGNSLSHDIYICEFKLKN